MRYCLVFILLLICFKPFSQTQIVRNIVWDASNTSKELTFINAQYPDFKSKLPYYGELLNNTDGAEVFLTNIEIEKICELGNNDSTAFKNYPDTFLFETFRYKNDGKEITKISLLPIYYNQSLNVIFRIKSFCINIKQTISSKKTLVQNLVKPSALSKGIWKRIKIKTDGVYKISYAQLKNEMGFSNPGNVGVFGNGGGLLPYNTNTSRAVDLRQNAIKQIKGDDGVFNEGDYLLFYGQGPNTWSYDSKKKIFIHSKHKSSEYSYYFITDEYGSGTEIPEESELNASNYNTTTFNDYQYYEADEKDKINFVNSGAEWFEPFPPSSNSKTLNFKFPNIENTVPGKIYYEFAAKSTSVATVEIKLADQILTSVSISSSDNNDYDIAQKAYGNISFTPSNSDFNINLQYSGNGSAFLSGGYINYLGINVRRKLVLTGSQMHFRDINSVSSLNIAKFTIENTTNENTIWDITDVCNPIEMQSTISGTTLSFNSSSSTLKQFIIFNSGSGFLEPIKLANNKIFEDVENQNIHGAETPELIIVVPNIDGIINQAKRLAKYRAEHDNLNVLVVSLDHIYNEFSSGKKDATAIRDMVKMFYERNTGSENDFKYLLLFGKGTYANNISNPNNYNLIPTYQSANSIYTTYSYVTDDFYGWMQNSGIDQANSLEIGVGRIPCKDSIEAEVVVSKLIEYDKPKNWSDWKNTLCFMADDTDLETNNIFAKHSNELADSALKNYPQFSFKKFYVDAFPQKTTSIGESTPELNTLLNNQIKKGALILNYIGHGNPTTLTSERVIDDKSILHWENGSKLPIVVTASCEVGRFDKVDTRTWNIETSLGEKILLKKDGGGIALLTTTRLVYEGDNFELNKAFYNYVFSKNIYGESYRLGDINRLAKNEASNTGINRLNFTLLGDPSMTPGYAKKNNIITDSINGTPYLNANNDTLKALSFATIKGHINTPNNLIDSLYNGIITTTVYDKLSKIETLGDKTNNSFAFTNRDNIIFKGQSKVMNGRFNVEFTIPKDINYEYDFGKILFYSTDSTTESAGYADKFTVGGLSGSIEEEFEGPEVNLYMNDTNFVSGGITDTNPKLFVRLYDTNGINATGSSIGHDITAILDDDNTQMVTLNDYFQTDISSYKSGATIFPYYNLSPGKHKIEVTAWDIFNNSSTSEIEFNVLPDTKKTIEKVGNYPNPFSTFTHFVFEHNFANDEVKIEIEIYTFTGAKLTTLTYNGTPSGYRNNLTWNGTDNNGRSLNKGMYLYKIIITEKNGGYAENYGKMLIVR
jgi:hypothetical protein